MRLNNVGMIAANTTRTKVYLQILGQKNLLPNYVLVIKENNNTTLPGQLKTIPDDINNVKDENYINWADYEFNIDLNKGLEDILNQFDITFESVNTNNVNDPEVADNIDNRAEEVFIYSGYGGVIVRKNLLNTGKGFLHAHGGYLPDYKGSTTNYYSLLDENKIGASTIFLTEEIDSGPVIKRKKFPPPPDKVEIDHVYDSIARAIVLVESIEDNMGKGIEEWEFVLENNKGGELYYIIHPVLKHLAILTK